VEWKVQQKGKHSRKANTVERPAQWKALQAKARVWGLCNAPRRGSGVSPAVVASTAMTNHFI